MCSTKYIKNSSKRDGAKGIHSENIPHCMWYFFVAIFCVTFSLAAPISTLDTMAVKVEGCPIRLYPHKPQEILHKVIDPCNDVSSKNSSNDQQTIVTANLSNTEPINIVGGHSTDTMLASYLALLSSGCTASIIGTRTLLTAAHCVPDTKDELIFSSLTAYLSSPQGQRGEEISVLDFLKDADVDFALLFLAKDIPSTSRIMPLNTNSSVPLVDTYARAVGYGITEEYGYQSNSQFILRQVDVPISEYSFCASQYENLEPPIAIQSEYQVCAGYQNGGCDSCQGDSGGPLIQYDINDEPIAVGIVSSGYGCARKGFPGIYIKVSPFRDLYELVSGKILASNEIKNVWKTEDDEEEVPTPSPNPRLKKSRIIIISITVGLLVIASIIFLVYCLIKKGVV